MRFLKLSALALAAGTTYGYHDTSPFFMFSTSELLLPSSNFQTASSIESPISQALSLCPSDYYIIVSQPGVQYSDYTSREQTPTLARHLSTSDTPTHIRSTVFVPEVVGSIHSSSWKSVLQSTCNAHFQHLDAEHGFEMPTSLSRKPCVYALDFGRLASTARADSLKNADDILGLVIESIGSSNYTVLYTTTSVSSKTDSVAKEGEDYIMDQSELEQTLHLDLKRDLSSHTFAKRENITLPEGGLFERYQFFSPGIFMGLFVGFILLMIAYVGVSALASLQVSYAAFDKEQGALAGPKKTQ